MGSRTILWQVLFGMSELVAGRGQVTRAEALRVKARELVKYVADHAPDELRESFQNLPDVRALLA
jgi:hypothetical protein